MDNNNNKSGNSFFNGFLLGILVGAAAVFLLGTEKGKRLLKAISEEDIGNISNILKEAEDVTKPDEVHKTSQRITPKRETIVKKEYLESKPKVRRFFRGVSRHLN